MSDAPRLPSLTASFGNDSPFPPLSTPRIPSGTFQSHAVPATPPLPPLRDQALQREQQLRVKEQQQRQRLNGQTGAARAGTRGLQPGQIIPSTQTPPPHIRMTSPLPMPMPPPNRAPSPQPPPKIPLGGSHPLYPLAIPIQRPSTAEPRGVHSPRGTMGLSSTTASMDNLDLAGQRRRVPSEQHVKRGSDDSRPAGGLDEAGGTTTATPSLSVVLPDLEALGRIREKALASGNDKRKLAWCKDVIKFVERKSEGAKISDPTLVAYIDECIKMINSLASSPSPVAEALYLRGDLLASGSFPSYHRKNLKLAFNDFELSARMGHPPSWFRIGRDYEILSDSGRARDAYERGCAVRDVGCIYRMGMANLLSQLDLAMNHERAIPLLREAADLANLDTPQPSYIYGMLLAGEFSHVEVSPRLLVPTPDPANPLQPVTIETEARRRIQRAAYLNFGPAQYRCGWSYEYAQLECSFDPLMSVQYYSLASQAGEIEADLALSKWFLCGAEGCFDKNESLAFTFAEKAARKGLPSAEFAMGYYFEVGVGSEKSLEVAQKWYNKAAGHGNNDAKERLAALQGPSPEALSRSQHEVHVDTQLQRKRTEAKMMSERKSKAAAAANGKRGAAGVNGPAATGPSNDLRRKNTMKMVEETARRGKAVKGMERTAPVNAVADWGRRGSVPDTSRLPTQAPTQSMPRPAMPMPASNPTPPRMVSPAPQSLPNRMPPSNHVQAPQPPVNGHPIYNTPANRPPARQGPGPPPRPAAASGNNGEAAAVKAPSSSSSQKQVYETFGEMGFAPAKAKDDKDCVIC